MDGIPWQVVTAIATPCVGGLVWIGKKAWGLLESHAERRTKAIEAIAPSIKSWFDEMGKHVSDHADKHARAVESAEQNIVAAVGAAKADIVEKIGISARLERLEAAAALKASAPEDPTVPERPDRPSTSRSGVQALRDSRPAISR
jgi:hypothetical protein